MRRRTLLALPLAACATARPRPRAGPAPAADELLEALRRRHRELRSVAMEALATSWLGGERTRGTVAIYADRDGRLRFDTETRLQTISALVVTRGRFGLLDFQKNVYFTGAACPENIAKVIPIPLLPEEIAAILLGDAPLGAGARAVGVDWDGARGAEVLALERPAAGAAATRLWVAFQRAGDLWRPIGVEGESPGVRGRWRVAYADHARAGALSLPDLVRFAEPGRSFDDGVDVKVKERESINRPLPQEKLALSAPEGWPTEQMLCPPGPGTPTVTRP